MIIKGKAQIIKDPKDFYRIKNEVIIIAKNTTPDIVVIMHYVKAIITEVDNRLCHAAIIAREYNKPLIMGQYGVTAKYKSGEIISINTVTKKICKA